MQFGVPAVSWLLPRQARSTARDLGPVRGTTTPEEGAAPEAVVRESSAESSASEADEQFATASTPIKQLLDDKPAESPAIISGARKLTKEEGTAASRQAASGAGGDASRSPASANPEALTKVSADQQHEPDSWQMVKLAHGNFDYGAALYASHCVVVLPGVSVAGRIELTPTRLLFFPEALVCQGSVEDVGVGDCQWVSAADVFQMEYDDGSSSATVGVGSMLGLHAASQGGAADAAHGPESLTTAMIGSRPEWIPDGNA